MEIAEFRGNETDTGGSVRGLDSRWVQYACLAAILCAAAFLRLAHLSEVGILGVDEGQYVLDGLAKAEEIKFVFGLVDRKVAELRGGADLRLEAVLPEAANALAAHHPFSPKLGFNYLTAFVILLAGFSVHVGNYVEAFSGVLMVWAVFALVERLHGPRAGLIAAGMLALSAYHIYFSRNAYPQCSSGLLLMVAVWLHVRWAELRDAGPSSRAPGWPLFLCGFFCGLSFWVNYQAAGALPLIPVVHALVCLESRGVVRKARDFLAGGVFIATGFLVVIVGAELLTYPMIMLFRMEGIRYTHGTFLELLGPRLTGQTSLPFNLSGLAIFPYFMTLFHGYAGVVGICVVFIVGGWAAWRRTRLSASALLKGRTYRQVVYLAVAFLVPFLIFSLKTMQGARMFTYGLPFFIGLVAVIVEVAWRHEGRRRSAIRFVLTGALAVCAVSSCLSAWEILSHRSAYPQALAYVQASGERSACAAWSSVTESYLIEAGMEGGSVYRYLGNDRTPPRLFFNDWQELYVQGYPDESVALTPESAPAKVLEHGFGRIFLETEAMPAFGNAVDNIRWTRNLDLDRARKLLVYDLTVSELR